MRVYLGGNLHTHWRKRIIVACEDFTSLNFLQPYKDDRAHFVRTAESVSLVDPSWFTPRDLLYIRNCDVVFGYITQYAEHSRHHGLMIEMGYAKALGKLIILVCEMPEFDMALAIADTILPTLQDGINYLKFLVLKNPI